MGFGDVLLIWSGLSLPIAVVVGRILRGGDLDGSARRRISDEARDGSANDSGF